MGPIYTVKMTLLVLLHSHGNSVLPRIISNLKTLQNPTAAKNRTVMMEDWIVMKDWVKNDDIELLSLLVAGTSRFNWIRGHHLGCSACTVKFWVARKTHLEQYVEMLPNNHKGSHVLVAYSSSWWWWVASIFANRSRCRNVYRAIRGETMNLAGCQHDLCF